MNTNENLLSAHNLAMSDLPINQGKPLTAALYRQQIMGIIGVQRGLCDLCLRVICGEVEPLSGSVTILGNDPWEVDQDTRRELRSKAIFLSHNTKLCSSFNGLMNIIVPALYHFGGSIESHLESAEELLEELQFEGNAEDLPSSFSQWQNQIIIIARALILNPKILFIESAFSSTDQTNRHLLENLYINICKYKHCALVLSTANYGFIDQHAHKIIQLDSENYHYKNNNH